jgi:hypothetical protein
MRIQSFMGKVGVESLHQMDQHINHWLETHGVEPKLVTQSFGYDRGKDGGGQEPVVVVCVWY